MPSIFNLRVTLGLTFLALASHLSASLILQTPTNPPAFTPGFGYTYYIDLTTPANSQYVVDDVNPDFSPFGPVPTAQFALTFTDGFGFQIQGGNGGEIMVDGLGSLVFLPPNGTIDPADPTLNLSTGPVLIPDGPFAIGLIVDGQNAATSLGSVNNMTGGFIPSPISFNSEPGPIGTYPGGGGPTAGQQRAHRAAKIAAQRAQQKAQQIRQQQTRRK